MSNTDDNTPDFDQLKGLTSSKGEAAPRLTRSQATNRDIFVDYAASPLAGDERMTRAEATAQWVENRNNPEIDAWFAAEYRNGIDVDRLDPAGNHYAVPTATQRDALAPAELAVAAHDEPTAPGRPSANWATTGHQLATHLNTINARDLSFSQAANLGVELVHHPDSVNNQVFHTADGDIIYLDEASNEWDVVDQGRVGQAIKSGNMNRVHIAYISKDAVVADTATISETATVEPGARVGPHATVGEHAHIGAGAIVSSYVRVEDGAFVGAFSSIRDGSRVGPGAVVGSGSRVGATTNIGAGARLEQHSEIRAFDNVPANSRLGGSAKQAGASGSKLNPQQISQLVDRLAALERE